MNIRLAKSSDLDAICEILKQAKEDLKALGIDQWQYSYPNRSTIEQDINLGRGYVLEENQQILGYCMMMKDYEPSYAKIDGAWMTGSTYVTVHRIMIHRDQKGKHLGELLFQEAERLAVFNGMKSVRIDTHPGNQPMQNLLKHAGFTYCGIIHLIGGEEDGHERLAYEKRCAHES